MSAIVNSSVNGLILNTSSGFNKKIQNTRNLLKNRLQTNLSLPLLCLLVLLQVDRSDGGEKPEMTEHFLRITISSTTNRYEISDPIFIEVQVTNIGAGKIPMKKAGFRNMFYYDVKRGSTSAPHTHFMKFGSEGLHTTTTDLSGTLSLQAHSGYRGEEEILNPGDVFEVSIPLSALFDLTSPGEYTVQLGTLVSGSPQSSGTPSDMKIRSNKLILTVDNFSDQGNQARIIRSKESK